MVAGGRFPLVTSRLTCQNNEFRPMNSPLPRLLSLLSSILPCAVATLLPAAALFLESASLSLRAEAPPAATQQTSPAAPAPQPFASGDTVAFVGDSITHGGYYPDYLYLFYATRFPQRKITFFNCGISGDTADGTLKRLDGDVLSHKPTVATIMLGMNDVNRGLYDPANTESDLPKRRADALAKHAANMHQIAERLSAANIRLIFITPSPFDQTSKMEKPNLPGVDNALAACAENARKLAEEFHGTLVDFHGPLDEINRTLQEKDPGATVIGQDRVHPGEKGHLIMAYLFLKAQKAPQFVADISVDAKGQKELHFPETEEALPFPVSEGSKDALKLVPFTADLNVERLRVTNLPEGAYELSIDGGKIASFPAAQWAAGINLAEFPQTPQYQQALEVARLDAKRHAIVQRLRTIDYVELMIALDMKREPGSLGDFDWKAELDKLSANPKITGWPHDRLADYAKLKPLQADMLREQADLVEAIRAASQPKEHQFTIRPAEAK
jgi:lysophospholipase L1-like esterase